MKATAPNLVNAMAFSRFVLNPLDYVPHSFFIRPFSNQYPKPVFVYPDNYDFPIRINSYIYSCLWFLIKSQILMFLWMVIKK